MKDPLRFIANDDAAREIEERRKAVSAASEQHHPIEVLGQRREGKGADVVEEEEQVEEIRARVLLARLEALSLVKSEERVSNENPVLLVGGGGHTKGSPRWCRLQGRNCHRRR
ncbi:unnamed protein product [Choristocarpus tenellus]